MPLEQGESISDFDAALQQLIETFRKRPHLHFPTDRRLSLDYTFPNIEGTNRPIHRRTNEQLRTFINAATTNFDFLSTPLEEWDDCVKFSNSRVNRARRAVTETETEANEDVATINQSKYAARQWFRGTYVPAVSRLGNFPLFILGQPGSGKSTIFKYLLVSNRSFLCEQKIIFSRFEALKCRIQCTAKSNHSALAEEVSTYIYRILLRDLLFYKAYNHANHQHPERVAFGLFSEANAANTFLNATASETIDAVTLEADQQRLLSALAAGGLRQAFIKGMSPQTCKGILDYAREKLGLQYCLIVDGLDAVSFFDEELDEFNFFVLKLLIDSITLKGAARDSDITFNIPLPLKATYILRRSTYLHLYKERKSPLNLVDDDASDEREYHVEPIDFRAALLGAVRRGLRAVTVDNVGSKDSGGPALEASLVTAIDSALTMISRTLFDRRSGQHVSLLFENDLRALLKFIRSLFNWITDVAQRPSERLLRQNATFPELVHFYGSLSAYRVLKQRGFRAIEFLMFQDGSAFQNAAALVGGHQGARTRPGVSAPSRIVKNLAFSGVLDNVFNYHHRQHPNHPDYHCLLARVRILQLSQPGRFSEEKWIWSELAEKVGFVVDDEAQRNIYLCLLANNGLVELRWGDGQYKVRRTLKGGILLRNILSQQRYLEHVFHRTLFPTKLVEHIQDEPRQDTSAASWTVRSIRNSFVLLTYMTFVENNPANSVACESELRIVSGVERSVIAAITKIVKARDKQVVRNAPPEDWIVNRSLALIQGTLNQWRRSGLIAHVLPTKGDL
jgi:hypothetical protein